MISWFARFAVISVFANPELRAPGQTRDTKTSVAATLAAGLQMLQCKGRPGIEFILHSIPPVWIALPFRLT